MSRLMCQWATCTRPAATVEDGWAHCLPHLRLHRLFEMETQRADERQQRKALRQAETLRQAIRRLHAAGYTDREIGEQLRCTPASIKGERQKIGLAANRLKTPQELAPHGTHAAFVRHRSHGEEPCDDCRLAERVYQRQRKRSLRARAAA